MSAVPEVLMKMIAYSEGNLHDIAHLVKVHSYARLIGERENVDPVTLETLEIAAILHDIACPLCRKKYGQADGKHQEEEGAPLAQAFLEDIDIPASMKERVAYLVGHHHTYQGVNGMDWQILLEADFLVNAHEEPYPPRTIESFRDNVYKTQTGRELLRAMYGT